VHCHTSNRNIEEENLKRYLLSIILCAPLFATVNVRNYGAQGNGIDDDTAALNAAFEAGCAQSGSVYLPTGVYLVDPLAPLNGCAATIYGDGNAKSILRFRANLAAGRWQSLWSFTGGSEKTLTIHDLALDGQHAELAGLSIDGYSTVAITGISSYNFGTPGYAQGHRGDYDGLYLINSEHATINSSQFTGNERMGVELQAVHNSTVSNSVMSGNGGMGGVSEQNFSGPLDGPLVAQWLSNTLASNGSGGIDVETDPNLPPAQGIVKGNHVISCGNNDWGSGWGLVLGMHAFGTVQGNEVDNFAANAPPSNYTSAIVYGNNGGPIQILNNTVKGTKSYGIVGSSGLFPVTITNNILTNNKTGIFIYQSPGVQVSGNTVTSSASAGIAVYWSDGATISGNNFTNNSPDLMINGVAAVPQ
jgi:parallel beta-helix repeat protein